MHGGDEHFHRPRCFLLQHGAHGDDAVHQQRRVEQNHQRDGHANRLAPFDGLALLADFDDLQIGAADDVSHVVHVNSAGAQARFDHGLVHSGR